VLSYIIPTRDRLDTLAATLGQIARLHTSAAARALPCEVIVADNASAQPVRQAWCDQIVAEATGHSPQRASVPVRVLALPGNIGAAARNAAADLADQQSRWLFMLDDDSAPIDLNFVEAILAAEQRSDVGAIAAEIWLGDVVDATLRLHESGGLPEVGIGCGLLVRRDAFCGLGGYDHAFGYYVEETDFAARLIAAGLRTVLDRRVQVLHRKVATGRDMNLIVSRLVRNNLWVTLRYAPRLEQLPRITETLWRYGRIAHKTAARAGYLSGVREAMATWANQPVRTMSAAHWDRLCGVAAVREKLALLRGGTGLCRGSVELLMPGKHAWAVRRGVKLSGAMVVRSGEGEIAMVANLSPGPAWDAVHFCARNGQAVTEPFDSQNPVASASEWNGGEGGVEPSDGKRAGQPRRAA